MKLRVINTDLNQENKLPLLMLSDPASFITKVITIQLSLHIQPQQQQHCLLTLVSHKKMK